jgi:PBP1b-binding outer membrane lipoprotein LpoB
MKKLICILASAALLGACEQKTETVAPAAPVEKKTENNTTVVNPPASTEKRTDTITTTAASPNP